MEILEFTKIVSSQAISEYLTNLSNQMTLVNPFYVFVLVGEKNDADSIEEIELCTRTFANTQTSPLIYSTLLYSNLI